MSNYNTLRKNNSQTNIFTTSRIANSMNLIGYKSFNKFGGINLSDILSLYPKQLINICWENLSRNIIENYQQGKGTFIKGLGTFTFSNYEVSLEGTTNQYERDIRKRKPVFIVSNEFNDNLMPGVFNEKNNLIYYTQKKNDDINIVKINYAKISYGANVSKEECYNILSTIFKTMSNQIKRKEFNEKKLNNLGVFVLQRNIFAMKFYDNIFDDVALKTRKLYHAKKNLRFYLETKDSSSVPHRNLIDVEKSMQEICPKFSVITKITPSADNWLKKNMSIDIKKEILDSKRKDILLKKANDKDEYNVDQRFYRSYPIQNLIGLKISQDILENILNNKEFIIRNMKLKDLHGDGLIPKYEFINAFREANCHKNLKVELIEKITDAYLKQDPNIIMIQYINFVNLLCNDIKKILNKENNLFPIKKYAFISPKTTKRSISQNCYNRESGNLESNSISSIFTYSKLPKINDALLRQDLIKISKIVNYLKNKNRMISYLELISMLQSYMISISKEKMIHILKYLKIKNPNAFYLSEFISKINNDKPKNLKNSKNISFNDFKNNTLNKNYSSPDLLNDKNVFEEKKNNENSNFDIKLIKPLKDRIFEESYKIDNISQYFDHLLAYNICRKANEIYPDEFERLLQLERYPFSISQINSIFNYIDTKNDGIIDREEFITAIRKTPYPISTLINYMKNNKISLIDLIYKMDIDIYNIPINEILKIYLTRPLFRVKIKLVNENFEREFIDDLFDSLTKTEKLPIKKILEIFNYDNDFTYKDIYKYKDEITNICLKTIPLNASYIELSKKFLSFDPQIKGKIPYKIFNEALNSFLKGKLQQEILHLLRAYKIIDAKNFVDYHKFLTLIYINVRDDSFVKCLYSFQNFLKKECSDDLFIFIVKINNMCNNICIKKYVEMEKMYEFFKKKVGNDLELSAVEKFDYDKDGKISMEDLKNVIINYLDKNYFDNISQIKEKTKINNDLLLYKENKDIYSLIKIALNKINLTEDNFFYFLDVNKDNYIDINEFEAQINKLPLDRKLNSKEIKKFFTHLDEFNTGKVDLNTFKQKLKHFNDYMIANNEKSYVGNPTIENLILNEISKWLRKNRNLCDTELFPILDHDHDGVVSINDFKFFCTNVLLMPKNELNNKKILHFIEAVSLTKKNNLVLADIQNLMRNIFENNTKNYFDNIHNFCGEGGDYKKKDISWIYDLINKIGFHINEMYLDDIEKFYNEYNISNFRNQGQGLSFDDFGNFLNQNLKLFESYHIKNEQKIALFNYISDNKKFINLQRLKFLFNNNNNKFDFYGKMHSDITKFIHNNYPKAEDAFKFFHKVKTNSQETPTFNDEISDQIFITKKDFFDGINLMFPKKYPTNTILNYYNKIFTKKNSNTENNIIKFSEFNYIYYQDFKFDSNYTASKNSPSKILTTRPSLKNKFFKTFNSPFQVKHHQKLETPYDLDPLEKIKRIILSSKNDFKTEYQKYLAKSDNGIINQFEFRNMIKKFCIGLTNIEIEDIMHKCGLNNFDGKINLFNFYNYIKEENKNLIVSRQHATEVIKEIKSLLYKYYSNPRLTFELNDSENKGIIDFEIFKKIIYDLYQREKKSPPNYPVMKYIYDFIDVRKDGLIDLNEWTSIFGKIEGKLDVNGLNKNKVKMLREWEISSDIVFVYKLIAKNRKLIKDKAKIYIEEDMFIKMDDLIEVLKSVLKDIKLSKTQWKMICSIGDKDKSGIVDFSGFMSLIEAVMKMEDACASAK